MEGWSRKSARYTALLFYLCVLLQILFLSLSLTLDSPSFMGELERNSQPPQAALLIQFGWWLIPLTIALNFSLYKLFINIFGFLARKLWHGFIYAPIMIYSTASAAGLCFAFWSLNQPLADYASNTSLHPDQKPHSSFRRVS